MRLSWTIGLAALLAGGRAWPQGAAAYDPQGVHVDAKGVLRSRTTDADPRLADLWKNAKSFQKDGRLLYVSLPRLFAEAKRLVESGKPLPDDVKHLGGMTKLQYVFVYPDAKDLVVAGPAEPFETKVPYRPLGRISGRPVLHLADLVTALRAFGPGKKPDRLGCDIEVTKEIQERVAAKAKAVGPTAQIIGFRKACDQIAEAGGPQPVKYFGLEPETRFAFVCVEADYRLKQLALGHLPSPTPKVESYRSLIGAPERQLRFSLESNYEALHVAPDGNAYELRGPSLKVNGGLLGNPESKPEDMTAAGRRFVTLCNENFDLLLRHLLSWADLCNLGDLSVLAALVAEDGLAEKSGWDLSWLLDPKGFPVPPMPAPASAATLCSVVVSGENAIFVSGGVWIKPAEWASKRAPADKLAEKASRPAEGWSATRK
jgi:uncharacterized protein DUF1598